MAFKSLVFILILPLCKAYLEPSGIMGSSNEQEKESESDKIERLRSWLNKTIIEPLPKYCYGPDEDNVPDKDLLIRHVPCHESGAIKR